MTDLPNCFRCGRQPCTCLDGITLYHGDCKTILPLLEPGSVDLVCCDPPYGIGFMGKEFDTFKPECIRKTVDTKARQNTETPKGHGRFESDACIQYDRSCAGNLAFQVWCAEMFTAILSACKPGTMLAAFGGTRTYHRLTCGIEDAGWEVRDCMMWLYGSGFPKGHRVDEAVRRSLPEVDWCQCDESTHSSENTCRGQRQDDRNNKAAVSADGVHSPSSADRSTHELQGSQGGCLPGQHSSGEPLPCPEEADQVSALSREYVPERTHSGEPADGSDSEQVCSPSLAPRTDLPSSRGSSPHTKPRPALQSRTRESTLPAGPSESASHKQDTCHKSSCNTPSNHNYTQGLPCCQACGKPKMVWTGYNVALKPAWEPIVLAMAPLDGNYAQNAIKHGVAGINVDGGRIGTATKDDYGRTPAKADGKLSLSRSPGYGLGEHCPEPHTSGRWPANLILQHHEGCVRVGVKKVKSARSDPAIDAGDFGKQGIYGKASGTTTQGYADADGLEEVEAWECHPDCPVGILDGQSGVSASGQDSGVRGTGGIWSGITNTPCGPQHGDTGTASRFFYCAKASGKDRGNLPAEDVGPLFPDESIPAFKNSHPTVKPLELIRYLLTLLYPPNPDAICLDPCAGSGTTGVAAKQLGRKCILIELEEEYCEIAARRLKQEVLFT